MGTWGTQGFGVNFKYRKVMMGVGVGWGLCFLVWLFFRKFNCIHTTEEKLEVHSYARETAQHAQLWKAQGQLKQHLEKHRVLRAPSFASLESVLRKGSFHSIQLLETHSILISHHLSHKQEVKPLGRDVPLWRVWPHRSHQVVCTFPVQGSSEFLPMFFCFSAVRWSFVWCFYGKCCRRAITLHLWNHQDLIAFPSRRRLFPPSPKQMNNSFSNMQLDSEDPNHSLHRA